MKEVEPGLLLHERYYILGKGGSFLALKVPRQCLLVLVEVRWR
jgi:hypothetical protein